MIDRKSWPSRFRLYIGGYLGHSYNVTIVGETLRYQAISQDGQQQTKDIIPTKEKWQRFWAKLESAGVWEWKPEYPNPGILDGTQWSIDIEHAGRSLTSRGDNNYPGKKAFNTFLEAVESVLGGLAFQ